LESSLPSLVPTGCDELHAVEEKYVFQADDGPKSLSDLFAGRSQLLDRAPMVREGAPADWPRRHYEYEDLAGGRIRSPRG
jgi:predicted dithiol-disulfide oxidoreductase (DUF899 family)